MEETPLPPNSGPAGAEAGPPSWPPVAGSEETAAPIPVSDASSASTPASSTQSEVLYGEVFAPGDKGYEPQSVESGNPALSAGQGAEAVVQSAEAERPGKVQRVGTALAHIVDKGLEAAGQLDKSGILGVVDDLTKGAPGKAGRVLRGVVTAGKAAARVDEVRQQGRDPERDDDVVSEEVFDLPPRQGDSRFVDARYVEPEPTTPPPSTGPGTTPPQKAQPAPPSGFWPPVSTEATASPAAPTPAPEEAKPTKEDTLPEDAKATTPPPAEDVTEPEPGHAEAKVKYQQWQLDNFALLDRLEQLGIHPNLGLPIDLGAVLADEATSEKWRQRAEWMARSKETEGGTVDWNGRTYDRQLPYVGPEAQLVSPFLPDGPPVRVGKPEDRSPHDQQDFGKGRLSVTEWLSRTKRHLLSGSADTVPGGRRQARRHRRATQAGFDEVDAGGGMSHGEVAAIAKRYAQVNQVSGSDQAAQPITRGGPPEERVRYRKLKFKN